MNNLATMETENAIKGTTEILVQVRQELAVLHDEVKSIRSDISKHNRRITYIEEEESITPAQAEAISSAVKARGVDCLGGKKSNAYKNGGIRRSVYRDIYFMMKREYGLVTEDGRQLSYKQLKKKYFKSALDNIHNYELPQELENDIIAENELDLDE